MNLEWDSRAFVGELAREATRTKGLSFDEIKDSANEIRREARRRCPVKTGKLRRSGRVRIRKARGESGREAVTVTFGGKSAPYAVPVHYDATLSHETGEDRFLEKAVDEVTGKGKLEANIAKRFRTR